MELIEKKIIELLNQADQSLTIKEFEILSESIIQYIDEIGLFDQCLWVQRARVQAQGNYHPWAPASYTIKCDDDNYRRVGVEYFLTLEEFREEKLNELGIWK